MHAAHFDQLIPHMKRAGFAATSLSALITASFGWTLGETLLARVSLAGMLALCTFIVGYALVALHQAFRRRMWGIAGAAGSLFAIAVLVELMSHAGFTAAHRDATIAQAKMQTASYTDSRETIASLKKTEGLLQERLRMQPKRTLSEAKAAIENTKSHRWWDLTSGCTETKGPKTRAWCDSYRSAEADVGAWGEIERAQTQLAEVQEKIAAARKSQGTLATAAGASQGTILASAFTLSTKPSDEQTFWATFALSSILALFAVAAGSLCNVIAFAFDPLPAPPERPIAGIRVEPKGTPPPLKPANDQTILAMINNDAIRRWAEKHGAQLKVA